MQNGLDEATLQATVNAYLGNGNNQVLTAQHLGIARSTLQDRLKKAQRLSLLPEPVNALAMGQALTGVSRQYKADGTPGIFWVKSNQRAEELRKALVTTAEALAKELPVLGRIPVSKQGYDKNLMTVVPFGDPHIGLYCSREEVGESFNLEIATKDLCSAFDHLISDGRETEHCVILNLGDFFHASNYEGITKRSKNVLDMAGRFPEIIEAGIEALRFCVERAAEKHKNVSLVNSIGNHDDEMAVCLSAFFKHMYKKTDRIQVHEAARTRHYIRHGKVLIGVTHGHQTKDKELPLLMATERSQDWGETKHRYFYRGHHHHKEVMEYNGCVVEQFRTLAPSDSYSHSRGYLSGRDMQAIIHHKEFGEVARTICSVDMLKSF